MTTTQISLLLLNACAVVALGIFARRQYNSYLVEKTANERRTEEMISRMQNTLAEAQTRLEQEIRLQQQQARHRAENEPLSATEHADANRRHAARRALMASWTVAEVSDFLSSLLRRSNSASPTPTSNGVHRHDDTTILPLFTRVNGASLLDMYADPAHGFSFGDKLFFMGVDKETCIVIEKGIDVWMGGG